MVLVQVGCRRVQLGCPDSPGDAGKGSSEAWERSTLSPAQWEGWPTELFCGLKTVEFLLIGNYISCYKARKL